MKMRAESVSIDNRLERGLINVLGKKNRYSKNPKNNLIPETEPDTILSAKLLLIIAQEANNKESGELKNSVNIISSVATVSKVPNNIIPFQNLNHSTSKFNSVKNFNTKNNLHSNKEKFSNIVVSNFLKDKNIEVWNGEFRGKIERNYEEQEFYSQILSESNQSWIIQQKEKGGDIDQIKSNSIYYDERPIRQSVNMGVWKKIDNQQLIPKHSWSSSTHQTFNKNKNEGNEVINIQNSRRGKFNWKRQKKKIDKSLKNISFLKKRSKIVYDPIQAINEGKDQGLNDSKNVTSMTNLKNIKARTDSGLRIWISSKNREEFRKVKCSSSDILQKQILKNSSITDWREDWLKEKAKHWVLNKSKIPRILNKSKKKNPICQTKRNSKKGKLESRYFRIIFNF